MSRMQETAVQPELGFRANNKDEFRPLKRLLSFMITHLVLILVPQPIESTKE